MATMIWLHPLEAFVQKFLSSDHHLLPETIWQLHLIEKWIFLTGVGLFFLALFFRQWQKIPPKTIKKILVLGIFVTAVLLRVVSIEGGFESMLDYDGIHYTVAAAEFVQSGNLTLPINQENHPIGKAPGFSLLIAPIYLFFKNSLGAAVFSPMLMGIGSLLLLYFLTKQLANQKSALLALLFLSLSPLHVTYSRLIMPSMGPLFFVLAGVILFMGEKTNAWKIFVAGLFFGFAAVIRYLAIAALPAALIYLIMQNQEVHQNKFKKVLILLGGAAIPLLGLFYYQWRVFGSPWLNGYSYWEHFFYSIQKPFSLSYALGIPPSSGGSPNALFALISATGVYIPYPNILISRVDQIGLSILVWFLAITGAIYFYSKNRPFLFFTLVFFVCYYLPHAFLFSQAGHFMLPVVPFVLLLAATGITCFLQKLPTWAPSVGRGILFAGSLAFLSLAYSYSHQPFGESPRQEFLQLIKTNVPKGTFLVTDFDAILFTHLVGRPQQITYISPSKKVLYADRERYLKGETLPPASWGAAEYLEKLQTLLQEERPVYLAQFFKGEYQEDYEKIFKTFLLNPVAQSKNFELYQLKTKRNEHGK